MRFDLLKVLLFAGIPICAASAGAIVKHLSQYPLKEAVTHPLFFLLPLLGGYECITGWYLYRPGVLHVDGAALSTLEPVIVISTTLIAILLGVGIWKETLNLAQAVAIILMVPLLIVALTGRVSLPFSLFN